MILQNKHLSEIDHSSPTLICSLMLIWIYPTHPRMPATARVILYISRMVNPNPNLHLWLESWVAGVDPKHDHQKKTPRNCRTSNKSGPLPVINGFPYPPFLWHPRGAVQQQLLSSVSHLQAEKPQDFQAWELNVLSVSQGGIFKKNLVNNGEIPFPTTVWMVLKPCK